MGTYLEESVRRLKEFEGAVPWMHLDSSGRVAVGVGSVLANVRAAGLLPFSLGGRAATAEEIAGEFARVSELTKGRSAHFYRKKRGLRLTDAVIDQRLRDVLAGSEGYLRANIAGYDRLPDEARLALLDMVYDLGPGRLFLEYPKLMAAIKKGDGRGAAGASSRRGASAARNAWTKEQFLAAAKQSVMDTKSQVEGLSWGWLPVLLGAAAVLTVVFRSNARPRTNAW